MSTQTETLGARDLLTEVFQTLVTKYAGVEMKFERGALAEIANDSDWHRTRIGYSRYKSVWVTTIGAKRWALAFGVAFGDYPAEPYNCDILALELHGPSDASVDIREVHGRISDSGYFRNSLIFAKASGELRSCHWSFATRMARYFNGMNLESYIAAGLTLDKNFILASTLSHPVIQAMGYKSDFVPVLVEVCEQLLRA